MPPDHPPALPGEVSSPRPRRSRSDTEFPLPPSLSSSPTRDLLPSAAGRAVPTNLEPRNQNAEPAVLLDLLLESFKSVAHKLRDLAAAQARHVNVIPPQLALVVMPLAVDMHQLDFVDQALPLH